MVYAIYFIILYKDDIKNTNKGSDSSIIENKLKLN